MVESFKEILRSSEGLFVCPFCKREFRALAYHTRQVHDVSARELRRMHGLKWNYQLITDDLKEFHRDLAIRNCEGEKLVKVGKATRFKKGQSGHKRVNWSPQAIYNLKTRKKK